MGSRSSEGPVWRQPSQTAPLGSAQAIAETPASARPLSVWAVPLLGASRFTAAAVLFLAVAGAAQLLVFRHFRFLKQSIVWRCVRRRLVNDNRVINFFVCVIYISAGVYMIQRRLQASNSSGVRTGFGWSKNPSGNPSVIFKRLRCDQAVLPGTGQHQQEMINADQRLEDGPKPLRHPVRRPDVAEVNENPFTQNPGHPQ
jgi:hypothetical protein